MPRFAFGCSLVCAALAAAGCGGGDNMYPVTGTVKFASGQVPQGEVAVVRFEPADMAANAESKAASGKIAPDGSFRLTSIDPNDGALAGDYKVVLTVYKTYAGRQSLINKKYTQAATTPLSAKVGPGGQSHFELVLDP